MRLKLLLLIADVSLFILCLILFLTGCATTVPPAPPCVYVHPVQLADYVAMERCP